MEKTKTSMMTRRHTLLLGIAAGATLPAIAACKPQGSSTSGGGATNSTSAANATSSGGAGSPTGLVATITFPGGNPAGGPFVFDIAAGNDIGSYTSFAGSFTQRCIRVRNAGLGNFFVDFRTDVGSNRLEVVFWNGEVFGQVPSGHVNDLPAYDCVISNNGSTIYSLSLPFHYWGCRWRYQSSRRPVIRTSDQIFLQNWLPPMSRQAARLEGYQGIIVPIPIPPLTNNPLTGNAPWTPFDPPNGKIYKDLALAVNVAAGATSITVSGGTVDRNDRVSIRLANGHWQTFLSLGLDGDTTFAVDKPFSFAAFAGTAAKVITMDMGLLMNNDGGGGGPGRPEIGIITDSQAEYLLTTGARQAAALDTIMAQAEMCASQWNSMFLPDSVTGAPVNYKQDAVRYASYTRNSIGNGPYGGSYYLIRGGAINTLWNNNATEHMANYFYVPYALTEDSYFAEAMQFAVQWDKGIDAYHKETDFGNLAADPTGNSGIVGPRPLWSYQAEPRNIGWGVRNTASAWNSAPENPPSWMLGKGYFASIGQDEAKIIDITLTKSTDTLQTVFRNPCTGDLVQVFETSYFLLSLAFAQWIGHPTGTGPQWKTPLVYFFDQITQLTNGTSGWNRQCPQITNEDPSTGVAAFSSIKNPAGHYRNWSEVWAARGAAYQSGPYANDPEPRCQQFASSVQNISIMLAAAMAAKSCGVPDATTACDWLNRLVDDSYPAPLFSVQYEMKWGFSGT